jgi:hypothetical protein
MKMAERGLVSAPNMAVGLPFNIGLTGLPPAGVPGMPGMPGVASGAPGSHLTGQ